MLGESGLGRLVGGVSPACWLRRFGLAVLLGVSAAAVATGDRAWAQTAVDGTMRGSVVDEAGVGVVGAMVRMEDRAAGVELRTVSGREGEFTVARVPAGAYVVSVEAQGYELSVVGEIEVQIGSVGEVVARLRRTSALADTSAAAGAAAESLAKANAIERMPVEAQRRELALPGLQH